MQLLVLLGADSVVVWKVLGPAPVFLSLYPCACRIMKSSYTIKIYSMNDQKVVISLKRFLLIQQCPPDWKSLDLYLFRDETVVFYVGQSYLAFARVWEHLLGGFKGHSIMGRFVWCNWPTSMKFTIELLSTQSEEFDDLGNDVNGAERLLIRQWSPCFNVSQNSQPTPLPQTYLPPNAPFRRRRSLNMLIHEAERAVKAEDTQLWMQSMK